MKNVMLIVSCLMVLSMVANADVVIVQDGLAGYAGTSDSQLDGQGTGGKIANFGLTGTNMMGSMGATLDVYGILRFDLSGVGVLAGKTINGATLTLTGVNHGYASPTGGIDVHEILPPNAGWIEGTGTMIAPVYVGWPALAGEVVWNEEAYLTSPWAGGPGCDNPGVDIAALPMGNLLWDKTGLPGGTMPPESTAISASVVQGWVDNPADNAGMLLKCQVLMATQNYFLTKDCGTQPYFPMLTIDYVPEPATMVLLGLGGLLIRRKR